MPPTYPPDDHGSDNPAALHRPYATAPADALDRLDAELDTPTLAAPQAQGDVIVLPWPETTAPSWRAEEYDKARTIPDAGLPVEGTGGSHWLLPADLTAPRPRYHLALKGNRLGTLVVPPHGAARLSHTEHPDLLIGPGMYVIQQQRRWTPHGRPTAATGD